MVHESKVREGVEQEHEAENLLLYSRTTSQSRPAIKLSEQVNVPARPLDPSRWAGDKPRCLHQCLEAGTSRSAGTQERGCVACGVNGRR